MEMRQRIHQLFLNIATFNLEQLVKKLDDIYLVGIIYKIRIDQQRIFRICKKKHSS